MSETTKSILVYFSTLLGVGIIIFVVLQIGSKLQAPASVGGRWKLEPSNNQLALCVDLPMTQTEVTLEIHQSGSHLQMILPIDSTNLIFNGRLDGLQFNTMTGGDAALVFSGSLDRQSETDILSATLAGTDCQIPVSLIGVRMEERLLSEGGH